MFGGATIAKNSHKSKYIYSGNGIAFDGAGSWSFGDDFAKDVIVFDGDSSPSSYTNNSKSVFLVLGKGSI